MLSKFVSRSHYHQAVRFCSCVIPVSFTVYLCFVTVRSRLNWVAIVMVDCSCDALLQCTAVMRVHYEYEEYSGICASICPLVVMYVELLASRLAWLHLFVCMYEGAVITSQYQTIVQALRVVISIRLTIVRSMLCICVYVYIKGTKQPKLCSWKSGLKCRSSGQLSKAKTAVKFR